MACTHRPPAPRLRPSAGRQTPPPDSSRENGGLGHLIMDLLRASPAPPPDVNETGSVIFCCWEGRPAFAEEVASSNTPETAQKRSKLSRFAKEKKGPKDYSRRSIEASSGCRWH